MSSEHLGFAAAFEADDVIGGDRLLDRHERLGLGLDPRECPVKLSD